MTNPDLIALAKRIDATKRRWLPYVSDVVNVTFSLDEADTISYALRHLASQSSYEAEVAPGPSDTPTSGDAVREALAGALKFIESQMHYSQPSYDSGEEPSDQFTYDAIPVVMALRAALKPEAAPAGSVREALEVIERQLYEMRSLRGWRLNLIRENLGKLRAALALSAPVEAPVAVKPLEWGEQRPTDEIGVTAQDAFSSIGHYIACDNGWFLLGQGGWYPTSDIEAAKAAAQADFEQRIRSALIATPRPLSSVDDLARVQPAIDNLTNYQEQCDQDGVMVKVSRQALDEVLTLLGGSAR